MTEGQCKTHTSEMIGMIGMTKVASVELRFIHFNRMKSERDPWHSEGWPDEAMDTVPQSKEGSSCDLKCKCKKKMKIPQKAI